MRFEYLPHEIIHYTTTRSGEALDEALYKLNDLKKSKEDNYSHTCESFKLKKVIKGRSKSIIYIEGTIEKKDSTQTIILLDCKVHNPALVFTDIIFYLLSIALFIFLSYLSFKNQAFYWSIFVPVIFALLTYKFSTIALENELSRLIQTIVKVTK